MVVEYINDIDNTAITSPDHTWSTYGILDGLSEIGSHIRSNLCYLTCIRRLIRSSAVTDRKDVFSFMRAQHDMSYYLLQVPWVNLAYGEIDKITI